MSTARFRRYALAGNYTVQGWVEPRVLWLVGALAQRQRELGVRGSTVEIGVHHGRLFIGLSLTATTGEPLIAIDLFADQLHNVDGSGKGDEAAFRRNLSLHGVNPSAVTIVGADSTTLGGEDVCSLGGVSARLFSVDGGHTAEIVEHDMHTAFDSLTAGGIIIADDVFNASWPGAIEGTLHFLDEQPGCVPFAIGFNKVLFTDGYHADEYRRVVQRVAIHRQWELKSTKLRGHSVDFVSAKLNMRVRLMAKHLLRR
jgi:hypothetical protein